MKCECENWARSFDTNKFKGGDGLPLVSNHHPNCPHYQDSLMDVWKVTDGGISAYMDNEQDAKDTAGEEESGDVITTKEKMPREIFENLREFDGF